MIFQGPFQSLTFCDSVISGKGEGWYTFFSANTVALLYLTALMLLGFYWTKGLGAATVLSFCFIPVLLSLCEPVCVVIH